MYDVRPEQYATVIRELIRHENDVTNHRIMWLLIVQGLLANAFVVARTEHADSGIALAGIFVTLSAFVLLYKSYQARGYLRFLGEEAKLGRLREDYLPLDGWPTKRIKNWRSNIWLCPWLQRASDLLEPYLFLPTLIVSAWVFLVLLPRILLKPALVLGLAIILTVIVLSVFCIAWVWSQRADEEEPTQWTVREPTVLRVKDSR
jgi:hypothetical protein